MKPGLAAWLVGAAGLLATLAGAADGPAAAVPVDASAQVLTRAVFTGNTAVPAADLQALVAPWLGRAVSEADLEALRLQLTQLYVARGFVSSGVLLRQVDAGGVLVFDVWEGRLAEVRLNGMAGLQDAYVARQLQRPGDGPLNMEVLRERFQLLLADPLFERLNARLLPGMQRGEAVLEVDVARAVPYQFTLLANNYRPASIGAGALGLAGTLRNLSGRGDVLDASLQGPLDRGGDLRGSLAWRLPLGYAGTQLHLALDQGSSSVVEESLRALNITGRLTSRELGLSQLLHESLARKLSVGVSTVQRENRTWLLGSPFSFTAGEPDGVTRERLWRFWQEATLRSETQVLALRSSFTWGRNNLQDTPELPTGANPVPSRYRLWSGQAQFMRQLTRDGVQFALRAAVQRSPDRLLALDGMAVGGVASVRGYRENQLVRDQAWFVNVELELPVLRDGERGLRLVAVPFYDQGQGRNHGDAATTLRSVGVATRLNWQGLSVDLAVARRLHPPELAQGQGATLQDQGVHLQLAYKF